MARLPRLFVEGVPLHVIVRGNNRQDVFRGEGDRIFFHRCLCELSSRASVKIHAYVMMSNHVHLLATGKERESVSWLMQQLGRRYVTYFNYLHRRTGGLWEGRFRSTLVQAERYFLTCQRYIELNPVRAGMVSHPEAFAWSSYRRCANGVPDDAVTTHPLYDNLALDVVSRRAASRALRGRHRCRDAPQDQELHPARMGARHRRVLRASEGEVRTAPGASAAWTTPKARIRVAGV